MPSHVAIRPAFARSKRPSRYGAATRVLSLVTLFVITSFLTLTAADADLWGHLTFGRDIVRSGIHASDPYSFTSDRPWINHEWLAEVMMWSAYRIGGEAGLVALKLAIVWAAGGLLLATWRPRGLTPAARDGLLLATALGVWPMLVTIRPQAFSLLCFAALLAWLVRFREGLAGRTWWLLGLPLLFGFWVNTHGGWLVGAGTLVVFVAWTLPDPRVPARDRWLLAAASVAAAISTVCNPYGARMLALLFDTVRPGRADILEWQPVTALPAVTLVLWLVPTLVAVAAMWRGRRSVPPWSIAIVVLLGVGSFRVARIVGFYSLAVAFLLAPHLPSTVPTVVADRPRLPRWQPALRSALIGVAIITMAVALFGRRLAMNGEWLPEPDAAAYVAAHRLEGTMLTWFDYGEYAIWHFAPALRVSMDGRRETVYSQRMIDLHFRIYRNAPDAVDAVDRMNPDFVWLPSVLPVVPALEAAGWRPAFQGPRSVLLSRRHALPGVTVRESIARPAFPGD